MVEITSVVIKIELGLNGFFLFQVTPTGRHARGFEESSWKPNEDQQDSFPKQKEDTKSDEFNRNSEERKSKTKRVKNYLKRCKDALSGTKPQPETKTEQNCSYWYVENETHVPEHRIDINDAIDNDHQTIDNSNKVDNADVLAGTENESKSLNDCEELFEKVGPNYNHNTDVDTDTDGNDECFEIGEGKEEGSLPQINEDLSDDTFDENKPGKHVSDLDIIFGNEVGNIYYIPRSILMSSLSRIEHFSFLNYRTRPIKYLSNYFVECCSFFIGIEIFFWSSMKRTTHIP